MKSYIKQLILGVCILWALDSDAQQNPVMTHYTLNPYLYNAAQVGETGYITVNAHYRRQWINMPDAPDTKLISAQGLIKNKFGVGAKLYYDQTHIVHNYGGLFSYAYYVRMKKNPEKHYFSIGLSVGFKGQQLRFNEGTIKDNLDPKIFYDGANNTVFDAEAGIKYRFKGLHLAAFASNLAPHSFNYTNSIKDLNFKPSYHIYGSAGYDILMGKNKNFALKPSALVRYIPNVPIQFDANLLFDWKNTIWIGGGYRYNNTGVWGTAGFRLFDAASFSYSYEQSIDGHQAALGSTHEITIEYRFKGGGNKKLKKQLEEKYDNMREKLLTKNRYLLDSLQKVKEDVAELENDVDATNDKINTLHNISESTTFNGKEVKHSLVGEVKFHVNSATLHKEQTTEADAILAQLKQLNDDKKLVMVRLEGSASIEGSETYNLVLSIKRNAALKDYLVSKGISEDMITTSSKGNAEALMRDKSYKHKEDVSPNPSDRNVKVYILFNE